MNLFPRRKLFVSRRHRRRRHLAILAVLLALVAAGVSAYTFAGATGAEDSSGEKGNVPAFRGVLPASSRAHPTRELAPEPPDTPVEAAYLAVAPELPGVSPESVTAVYRSKLDPSWASVHIKPSGEKKFFVVFVKRDGKAWKAEKSIRADEPDHPDNELVPLGGVPKDLVEHIYPQNEFAADVPVPEKVSFKKEDLPSAGPAEFPPPEPTSDGGPDSERVKKALEEAKRRIEGYRGVAGIYVRDLKGGWGYGIRPDEQFFTASIIKVPVMVAVYRKVDAGELEFSQMVEIKDEDWAAGAGWLQWEKAGTKQTVSDLLLLMMTQSDNVATNALVRLVGGPEHVNEVARSLGAEDTVLYQKLSSERAAVPSLDNHTTPRDMVAMMEKIASGKAASPQSCRYMIELMHLDELDWWLDAGLPDDVDAANKAGWLYRVYDEAGIVKAGDRPYVVAILSKYGPEDVDRGRLLIEDLSRIVWEAQNGSGGS